MRAALKSYLASIAWLVTTIANIARRKPRVFTLSVFLMETHLVMTFLAMVLPLKVVLLAASEGIPSYTPFITPETKFTWIAGLALGAVVAFMLAQLVDSVVKRVCDSAGTELMAESTDIQIVPNQDERTATFFTQMSSVVAQCVFVGAAMVLYALLAPLTFATLAGMVVISFGFGSLLAIVGNRWGLGGLHKAITRHTHAYISLNSAVIFFSCFLVILLPYFAGWPLNMLVALISIVLLRRTLSALSSAVGTCVKLISNHHFVDALMFREKQLVQVKTAREQTIAAMFARRKRRELANDILKHAGLDTKANDVVWLDPVVSGTLSFLVHCNDTRVLHLQVYPPTRTFIPSNEDALFAVMGREALPAPELIGELQYGDFVCRLLTAGDGELPEAKEWIATLRSAIDQIAGVVPREELVAIYTSTRQFPHQTLTDEFVDRIEVALRAGQDRKLFEGFKRDLPALRKKLAEMPLTIGNASMSRMHAVTGGDDVATFLYWGQWSLEPLGAGIMLGIDPQFYAEHLVELRRLRPDLPSSLTVNDLLVGRHVQVLISRIQRQAYASALETIRDIVALRQQPPKMLAAAE